MENLTNDTPPKKAVLDPPSYGTFSTPLTCQCSVFAVQKSMTEQTRSSFGGVQKFSGERVLWYVFLPPYVLHPPISRPNEVSSQPLVKIPAFPWPKSAKPRRKSAKTKSLELSGHVRPRQGTEICNFGGAVSTGFFEFLQRIFFPFLQVYCAI